MAKATLSKSEAIRKIVEKQPKASRADIQAALKEQGVKASDALISKIKYGRSGTKPRGRKRRNGTTKAESIRQAWSELGGHTRPRDIVAHLANSGVKVSAAQVSMLRGKNGKAQVVQDAVSLDDLVAARDFAARLGSIEAAREALKGLARILPN